MKLRGASNLLTLGTALLAILLVAFPASGWAVAGDPDDDGLYTFDEITTDPLLADSDFDGLLDGREMTITGTNPADAYSHDDSDLIVDGLWDSDAGGVPDGVEVVNGSNPFDDSDDSAILAPAEPIGVPFLSTTPKGVPVDLSGLTLGAGVYILQFDSTPRFTAPVMKSFTVTGAPSVVIDATLWKTITAKGDVVYWRVLKREGAPAIADPTFTGRRWSSLIRTIRITGGPVLAGPVDGSVRDVTSVPTFTWKGNFPGGFRLLVTGSHRYGIELAYPTSNTLFAATKKSFKPTVAQWKLITAMGNKLSWRVVGKTKAGQLAFSERFDISLTGGAGMPDPAPAGDNVVRRVGGDPAVIPTFSLARGTATQYRFVFSHRGDFSTVDFVWPATDWQSFTENTVSYTPSAAEWTTITALGNPFFWTVRGFIPAVGTTPAANTWGPITRQEMTWDATAITAGTTLLSGIPGLNSVPADLPTFTFSPVGAASADSLIFAGDRRGDSTSVNTLLGESWGPMTQNDAVVVARLDTFYPYANLRKGILGANPPPASPVAPLVGGSLYYQFTAPARLSGPFVVAPTLLDLGGTVDAGTTYNVRFRKSPSENTPGLVQFYELQEAKDAKFSSINATWLIPATGAAPYLQPVKKAASGVTFYYRVRACNAFAHSVWSNSDNKTVKWVPVYEYTSAMGTRPPFDMGIKDIDLDDNVSNPAKGTVKVEGPGWISRCESGFGCGYGYGGDYRFITRANEISGKEKATYTPKIVTPGNYEIWVDWMMSENGDTHVEYFVQVDGAEYGPYVANMHIGATYGVTWMRLGTFQLPAGTNSFVQIRFSQEGTSHSERCDGVVFYYKK